MDEVLLSWFDEHRFKYVLMNNTLFRIGNNKFYQYKEKWLSKC